MIRLVVIFFRQVQTNKRDEKYHQFIFTCAFVCHTHPVAVALDLRKWLVVESGHSQWTRFQTERPSGLGFIICWGQQLCLSVSPAKRNKRCYFSLFDGVYIHAKEEIASSGSMYLTLLLKCKFSKEACYGFSDSRFLPTCCISYLIDFIEEECSSLLHNGCYTMPSESKVTDGGTRL